MGPKKKDKGGDSGDTLTRIAIVGAEKYVITSSWGHLCQGCDWLCADGSVGRAMQAPF